MDKKSRGVVMKGLNTKIIKSIVFPLPPFTEQGRIVNKLEELFTKLDAGVKSLQNIKAQLQLHRQAVLNHAFNGKLTEEWRRTHKGMIEPASTLLKEILEDRRDKWEKNQITSFEAKREIPENDIWKKRYKEPGEPDGENLPELPEEWKWVTLNQITWYVKDGPHYSPRYVERGIPFISGGNVRPSGVDFSNAKQISKELHQNLSKRCRPEVGDILYTKGGTTGIARVNSYERDFNVWVHVAVLKLAGPIEPFYVQHALNSPFCYAQAQKFTHGVGNQDLGLTRMIRIVLSLPPLLEQREIISKVDYLLSIVEEIELLVEINLKNAENLRHSILKHAFLGKLVPQDSNDEPTEKLLERIRKDKERLRRKKANRNKGD